MRNNYLLLLTLILLAACTNSHSEITPRKTIIAGQIRNLDSIDNQAIKVNFTDPLMDISIAQWLDENGYFHTESNICFTQNITVSYGRKFINILVSPGDSIFLDIDMNLFRKGTFDGLTFSGNSSHLEFNSQFPKFYEYCCSHFNFEPDCSLSAEEFLSQLKQKLDADYAKIDNYAATNKILPELVSWFKKDLIYIYANYSLDYGADNPAQQVKVFTDSIFDIDNPENFSSMMFQYHLRATGASIISADSAFQVFTQTEDFRGKFRRSIELLSERPATICRDYMIFDLLKDIIEEDSSRREIISPEVFIDQIFAEKLCLRQAQINKQHPAVSGKGITYLENNQYQSISTDDFITYLCRQHSGKVLYIDVWATWCSPCRAEMSPAKELRKTFAGKDVVFIYLCLDSSKDQWLTSIADNEISGENYFFDSDASKLFMSSFNLSGYPSYLLIDKGGTIVTTKAPRPSHSAGVTQSLENLLI